MTIGVAGLVGYGFAWPQLASIGFGTKPTAAIPSLAFLLLGAGLRHLCDGSPTDRGKTRRIAVVAAAVLLLILVPSLLASERWAEWGSRAGISLQADPLTTVLVSLAAVALLLLPTRRNLVSHVRATAMLLACVIILYGQSLHIPAFAHRDESLVPMLPTTFALTALALAVLIARPRGWLVPLFSRTSVGRLVRILLPAAFLVPFVAVELRDLSLSLHLPPEAGLTVVIAVNVLFSAGLVLGAGVLLHHRESDRLRLAAIVDSSFEAITTETLDRRIESWNAGAQRLYGYTAKEAIGQPVDLLIPHESRAKRRSLIERVRSDSAVAPYEAVRLTKAGNRVDVLVSAAPIFDDQGEVAGISTIAHDITERKKQERQIVTLAEQYATLIATTQDGYILLDQKGQILEVNDTYCRMTGYSREELLSMHLLDLRAIETVAETEVRLRGIIESGFSRFETRHRTRDGRVLEIEASVALCPSTGWLIEFARDITEQKRAQQRLERSEERLQLAQHAAGIGHFSWDIEDGVLEWSDELMALYGLELGSFGGRCEDWRRCVLPEDLASAEAAIERSWTTGELRTDFRIRRPDQTVRWIHVRARVFFSSEGQPVRMVGINMDVTDRTRIERDLARKTADLERLNASLEREIEARTESEEAHRRLSTVVEQAAESIIITDANGVIEYVNPAFERVTGYSSEESIGQTPRLLKSGRQDEDFYRALWATLASGQVWNGRFTNRRKDGSVFDEEATITPVRANDGRVTKYVAIKRDVTEEIRLRTQLEHAQKIEAIGTLAGGVAHDFNNLLQGMLTLVQVLLKKLDVKGPATLHLGQLEKTIRRGSELTRQLLLFARREASTRAAFDLSAAMSDLLPFLRRVIRENVRFSVRLSSQPVWVRADRGQIDQVVMNLISNAVDAMPSGGELTIATEAGEDKALLTVTDTGSGVPREIRSRIFEPFFTTKTVGSGTGLGLAVVHGIVTSHSGRIVLECPDEGGSMFRVELPLEPVRAKEDAAAETGPPVPLGNGERILVVEDDEMVRAGLRALLESLDYDVVTAVSGEDALTLELGAGAVLLTDYMLPGMHGLDVGRSLRSRWPDLRTILMSGYAAPGALDEAIETKEVVFLRKPFDVSQLAIAVQSALQTAS